jgi:uncharacterized phage infection (PIP) family protein YhgE
MRQVNSPEHMAKMRARIRTGSHSAENKLRKLNEQITKVRDRLNSLEAKADRMRAVIERRNMAKQAKQDQQVDDRVEQALQQLVQVLLASTHKNIG